MFRLSIFLLLLAPWLAHASIVGTPLPAGMDAQQAQQALALFHDEARALEQAMGGKMRIVVLETNDPIARNFIARGILHTDSDSFQQQENGLAAVLAEGGQMNGERAAICYVVFNPARAGHVWRNFIQGMANQDSLAPGTAFLVGHETGHCLDTLERNNRLKVGSSTRAQAATFGIQPDAWQRTDGSEQVDQQRYARIAKALFADPAQRQYQERVADAFGVLWAWHRAAGTGLAQAVREQRGHAETWSSHATAPALEGIDAFREQASVAGLGDLWIIARGFQVKSGVDARLAMGGDKVQQTPPSQENKDDQVVAQQAPKQKRGDIRQKDGLGRVRFENLRRFGSGMNGGR